MGQEEFSFITIIVRNAGCTLPRVHNAYKHTKDMESSPLNNPTILNLKVKGVKAAQ